MANLARSFNTGEWSDLIIRCNGSELKVHKVVVCNQSSFFKNACKGNFKEAATNEIDLDEDDPITVEVMLRFMYHQDYSEITYTSLYDKHQPFFADVCTYSIADKYMFDALKEATVSHIREFAKERDLDGDFIRALEHTCRVTASNNNLRVAMLDICTNYRQTLLPPGSWFEHEFKDFLQNNPTFAAELAQRLAQRLDDFTGSEGKTFRCPSCQKCWKADYESTARRCHCAHCGHPIMAQHMRIYEVSAEESS